MVGISADGGKDTESEGGEDEEREEEEEGPVFEGAGAVIVGDLEELGVVIAGLGSGRGKGAVYG